MKLGIASIVASLLLFSIPNILVEAAQNGAIHGPPRRVVPVSTTTTAIVADTTAIPNADDGNKSNITDIPIQIPRRLFSRSYPPPLKDLLLPPTSPSRITPLSVSEASVICQNQFFGLTPENWIMSGATDFLETYTAATSGDFLRQTHGLLGSMAYRYLGEEGWTCGVENTQGCTVSCKEIVMAIEDLEEARNVYFVLTSVAHFTAVTDLIHSGLSHAQSNVGMMAPKMAFDFFWSKRHTHADDVKLMLHLVITGMGQLMELLTPFVPFVQVIENLHKQLDNFDTDMARRVEMEHVSWLFLRTAVMFDAIYAHEWPGYLKDTLEAQQQIGFYAHITGMRGCREKEYFERKYTFDDKSWWLYRGQERETEKQPDGRAWKGGFNNIFDRLTRCGWKRRDGELCDREGGPAHPPSHTEYTWKGIYQEENDRIRAMREFKEEADRKMWKMKNDAKRIGIKAFVGWLPTVLLEINDWLAAEDEAPRQDINLAWLSLRIQESTRQARTHLRKAHDEMMNPSECGTSGETTLSFVLSTGLYLPSNTHMLKDFTHHDIENKITKNIFHKALNSALKAQKVYITCTPELQSRKKPHHNSGDTASSCSKDNTGPADLKSCITLTAEQSRARGLGNDPVELVCYMYKWATRGDKTRHYNERPAGSDNWEDDWGVIPRDVITSSVRSHLGEYDDSSILVSLEKRPSPETIADPSAPGVFTIPVCISRHNWNNGLRDFGHFDKLSSQTSKKNLPCSCGFWGDETEQVWRDMGIWDTHRSYYRTDLCANQRKKHMSDPLEIYVNDCRLESRKGAFKPKLGKDGLCDIVLNVLDELRKRGYEEDLDPEIRDFIYCRINNDKNCKKLDLKLDEPFDTIFDQLGDRPYVKQPSVPESAIHAGEALYIADDLYGMSLKLALTAEYEDRLEKQNNRKPEKKDVAPEKTFVHGAARKR